MHPWGAGSSIVKNHPVVQIAWSDALAYCSWVERRLPTEAEWEKAASWDELKKQRYVYLWGDEFVCSNGNFNDQYYVDSGMLNCDGYTYTAPVGSFLKGASPYGALDLAGNVYEWVSSLAQPYPYSATDGREDLSVSGYRVARGGSWTALSYYLRNFDRDEYPTVGHDLGFRCAMDASE
jgi:formylglycine-generating enzyme required for sulfatase activity